MNLFKSILIVLIILLVVAQPALKNKPSVAKNFDYIEVSKAVDNLSVAKYTPAQAQSYIAEDVQKKIDDFDREYTLEEELDWGQCRNETGKTLAVYGSKPDFDDDDDDYTYNYTYDNALYFLAAGQTTKNKWDCDGVYLPSDFTATDLSPNRQGKELGGPVAVKIADGTQLVVQTNPQTAAVELNVPRTKVFKAGEVNWFIPNVSQAVIDTRVPNAPAVKSLSPTSKFKILGAERWD